MEIKILYTISSQKKAVDWVFRKFPIHPVKYWNSRVFDVCFTFGHRLQFQLFRNFSFFHCPWFLGKFHVHARQIELNRGSFILAWMLKKKPFDENVECTELGELISRRMKKELFVFCCRNDFTLLSRFFHLTRRIFSISAESLHHVAIKAYIPYFFSSVWVLIKEIR